MRLINIGHNYKHDEHFSIERPNGSGDYLFLLVKTPAIFIIDNREMKVRANTIILYKEGTAQRYKADGEEFINDWFHFIVDDQEWFDKLNLPMDKLVENCGNFMVNGISTMIMDMAGEKSGRGIYSEQITELLLKRFLLKLSEFLFIKDTERVAFERFEALRCLRNEIFNRPYHKWSIPEISACANMSVSHFEHVYKRIYGVSCISDIINSRMDYSKYHLAKSSFAIKYIAEICGYENEEHFMRQFKRCVGMTPTEYRKMHQYR